MWRYYSMCYEKCDEKKNQCCRDENKKDGFDYQECGENCQNPEVMPEVLERDSKNHESEDSEPEDSHSENNEKKTESKSQESRNSEQGSEDMKQNGFESEWEMDLESDQRGDLACCKQLADIKEKYAHMTADFNNFRLRVEKEKMQWS